MIEDIRSEDKMAFNIRAKASMRAYLQSKSWEEKVESIERMNAFSKIAREAMRRRLAEDDEVERRESR